MFYNAADFKENSTVTCVGFAPATGTFPNNLKWKNSRAAISWVNKEGFDQEVSAIDPTTVKTPDGKLYLITEGGITHGTDLT